LLCKYIDKKELNKDDVTFVNEAAKIVPISEDFAYNRLGIDKPKDGETLIDTSKLDDKKIEPMNKKDAEFSAHFSADNASTPLDNATDKMVGDLYDLMFNNAESLEEIKANIEKAFPGIDETQLAELIKQELMFNYLEEQAAAQDEANAR
jgi:hypothetical protein